MLNQLLLCAAFAHPHATAVVSGQKEHSYSWVVEEGARIAQGLKVLGIGPSDRVAIWMKKSAQTVATMHAVLQLGAVYVPLDPSGPNQRAATICASCEVSVLVHDRPPEDLLEATFSGLKTLSACNNANADMRWDELTANPGEIQGVKRQGRDLAFILYTSGSTGTPKGVCISHENALAFISWAVAELDLTADDRLANHAPFHFDLSVFDLYASFSVGAAVHIISESIAYSGHALAKFVFEQGITVWYSVPTAIVMMCDNGDFLENDKLKLHTLIFAGEVFPVKKLAAVQSAHKKLRLLNFFGPTETNVCTYYEVREDLNKRDDPIPIGAVCSGNKAWAQKEDGSVAENEGDVGELIIQGPTVMLGYWGKPPLPEGHVYATGDLVRLLGNGQFNYLGRKDNMIKIQGFRVELGEIEAVVERYPGVSCCSVIATDKDGRKELTAFLDCGKAERPSLIQLKMHCAAALPPYMVVHRSVFLDTFPRTANGKVDRLNLVEVANQHV